MRHYEIILMINPDHSDQVSYMIAQYKKLILSNQGMIHRLEDWGRRSLAYPIKKLRKAHYILLNVEVTCHVMHELENIFKFNDDIIRSMVLRVKKVITGISPIMVQLQNDHKDECILDSSLSHYKNN